jgi:hypothetical protein
MQEGLKIMKVADEKVGKTTLDMLRNVGIPLESEYKPKK